MKDVKEEKPELKTWQDLVKIWLNRLVWFALIMGCWYFHNHYISPQQPIIIQVEK